MMFINKILVITAGESSSGNAAPSYFLGKN